MTGVAVAAVILGLLWREINFPDDRIGRRFAAVVALFNAVELATLMRIEAGLGAGDAMAAGPTGKSVFRNCAACHAVDKVLAGPSLREVYTIYRDNPQGIVDWAKNPGKKRPEFVQMPSMAQLGDDNLALVADYMLELGAMESLPAEPEQM
jgi:cytochrome c